MMRATAIQLSLALLALVGCRDGYRHDARNQYGCLDRRTSVTAEQTLPLGFTADQVLAFVNGSREADLQWPDGTATRLRHALGAPALFLVDSEPDPDFPYDIAVQCRDHLVVEAAVALSTSDGQLDERWPAVFIRAFEGTRAESVLTVKRDQLAGGHRSNLPAGQCLLGLQFNSSFTAAGFSGRILQTVALAPCDQLRDQTGVTPRPGGSWGTPPP